MKRIAVFLISLVVASCDLSSTEPLPITSEQIFNYQTEIIELSESIPCTNASEWKFIPMGSKACGGPTRYIAYHQSIEKRFLDLVQSFTAIQKAFNEKRTTTHYPCKIKLFPKQPHTYGGVIPEITPIGSPIIDELGKLFFNLSINFSSTPSPPKVTNFTESKILPPDINIL